MSKSVDDETVGRLKALYLDDTKHACYQNIPDFLAESIDIANVLQPLWRDDVPRLTLLRQIVDFRSVKGMADIGANTGYFSLSLAHDFPKMLVTAIEGNRNHATFVKEIASIMNFSNIKVINEFVDENTSPAKLNHELLLHFNVLHHLGVDHGKRDRGQQVFFEHAVKALKRISHNKAQLVFQMGFNWGGDKSRPIVALNDDIGKLRFVERLMDDAGFTINYIALPTLRDDGERYQYQAYLYEQVSSDQAYCKLLNQHDVTNLSEFFRRPIFFCKASS